MAFGFMVKAVAVSALAAAAASAGVSSSSAGEAPAAPLRLCADPTNLPFSSDDPAKPGLYLEIGDAIGKALGRPVTHVWYRTYFGKRAVRVTMLSKECDATIGLPDSDDFMGPQASSSPSPCSISATPSSRRRTRRSRASKRSRASGSRCSSRPSRRTWSARATTSTPSLCSRPTRA